MFMLASLSVYSLSSQISFNSHSIEIQNIYIALIFIWLIVLGADFAYAMFLLLKTNISLKKFFESKIRRDEEKIIIISEDELRGLKSLDQSREKPRSKIFPVDQN